MNLAAIVPLNSREFTKTRLASVLDATGRASLARWLALRVLDALKHAHVPQIAVISPDDEVLHWAWQSGAQPVRQNGSGLNEALGIGREWAMRRNAEALMVVLGDLPLITAEDILSVAELPHEEAHRQPSATIAPDRAGKGTNLLLMRPPDAFPFAFGDDSLARHIALARATGIEPRIVRRPGAAFDVDTPADLRELIGHGLWRPPSAHPHLYAGEAS